MIPYATVEVDSDGSGYRAISETHWAPVSLRPGQHSFRFSRGDRVHKATVSLEVGRAYILRADMRSSQPPTLREKADD